MDKLEIARFRLLVTDALRTAKKRYSYRELSNVVGIDATLLAKYVNGLLVPSYEHSLKIWKGLKNLLDPSKIVLDVAKNYRGLLDLTPIITDPLFLRIISLEFLERFKNNNISKILVPETSGISLATALSLHFNVPLVIARRTKENPFEEYVEGLRVESPRISRIFYVPKKSINKNDYVLVVDDIIQTGITLAALEDIVEKVGATIVGVAALVVVGEEWRRRLRTDRIEALLFLSGRHSVL